MTDRSEIEGLPDPPRLPRPMPDPPTAGWWLSPDGYDPRVVRYHDGEDWTDFVCRLGLRGPGNVTRSPRQSEQSPSPQEDPEIARLPEPPRFPKPLPELHAPDDGWFIDPDSRRLRDLRYREHGEWTDFVCVLDLRGAGAVERRPRTKKD